MSATYKAGFQLDDSEQSNVELTTMKMNNSLQNTRTLEKLINEGDSSCINLLHQQLTDRDMSMIIDLVITKKKCHDLRLGYNEITSDGVKILADTLENNTCVRRLNLFNNKISDQGVYHLTNICSSNLQALFLGQNQITDQGAEYLSTMLRSNQILTQLGLASNEITDQGVILFAKSLAEQNSSLKELYLWGNKSIGDGCIDALADMLVYNRTLNKLVLFDCSLSDLSKDRLREVVQSREKFELCL